MHSTKPFMLTVAFSNLFICQNATQTKLFTLSNDLSVTTKFKCDILIKYTAQLPHTLAN